MNINNKILCLVLGSFLSIGGTQASVIPIVSANKLKDLLVELNHSITKPAQSTEVCHRELSKQYKAFFNLKSENLELSSFNSIALKDLIDLSFKSRLKLKEKLKRLKVKNSDDQRCLSSVRNISRVLRYVEDYLIEFYVGLDQKMKASYTTLKGGFPELLVNPDFHFAGAEDLKSGDVILSRGNAFTSSAIARIGTVDTQFSHLTFVYEDKECTLNTGAKCLFTTEAHIEIGSVVAPIQTHVKQGNSRTVVFRMKDEALAHEASKYMYDKVKNSKKNIKYDFAMNYKDPDRLFCSEVIYDGFFNVSNKSVDIPLHKMKFPRGLIPFLNQMGIKVNNENIDSFETFSPGDIEYDPRFELVAEWRNPLKLADTRIKDIVLTSMFEWMEELDYRFKVSFLTDVKAKAAWVARRLPIVNNLLKKSVPVNMTKSQMNLFITLDQIGIKLENKIKSQIAVDEDNPLTPKDMFVILEQFRKDDMKKYLITGKSRIISGKFRRRKPRRSIFHGLFRPSLSKMKKLKINK